MFNVNWKRWGLVLSISLVMFLAACGNSNESSGDYSKDVDYQITGIEAGAGVFKASETAVKEYGLDGWEVVASSSGAMATALGEAIDKEQPIIVTGWSPHWKFSEYDLKYLDDPKGVFGEAEIIATMVREGLEEEKPEAYKVLDQFNWTADDIESVMLDIENGVAEEEAAQAWIDENEDKVAEWLDGVDEVDGQEVELVYVLWDTEIASNNVLKLAMESVGFDVTITPIDNAIMWKAVADGEADGMIAAWLPGTHEDLYEEYKDQMVDLGANLEGAKIGLVVPSYMDIDSIEDLNAK
ncbi:MAG TPA: glycine betaine ABC transporter substrate-binding protein [Atopostipes sp.]|nr:glycine betaine ABC transporter substrate-binding protein [Atopostipes sp.]